MLQSLKKIPIDTTLYVATFVLAGVKLLIAGTTIFGSHMSAFGSSDFGIMIAAAGGIHVARRHSANLTKEDEK